MARVLLGFMRGVLCHTSYLRPNPVYTDIKYIWLSWDGIYGISNIVGYLMPNPFIYMYIEYIWFGLVRFYGITTIVGYLMPNPLYTHISNIHHLVWLGLMAYKLLYVILCQILFIYIYHHHHHHVAPPARISLTVSRHFSLSFIASGRSSGLQPVSSHSCCM